MVCLSWSSWAALCDSSVHTLLDCDERGVWLCSTVQWCRFLYSDEQPEWQNMMSQEYAIMIVEADSFTGCDISPVPSMPVFPWFIMFFLHSAKSLVPAQIMIASQCSLVMISWPIVCAPMPCYVFSHLQHQSTPCLQVKWSQQFMPCKEVTHILTKPSYILLLHLPPMSSYTDVGGTQCRWDFACSFTCSEWWTAVSVIWSLGVFVCCVECHLDLYVV